MAIADGLCRSYLREALRGVHQHDDDYRIALYGEGASLSEATTAYTATGEVSGPGYTAGGMALSGFTDGLDGRTVTITWDDPVWSVATITARGALVYNASRANAAVAVLAFGGDVQSTDAPFTVQLPDDGVVRLT